ncbi:hypothetical protein [Clostridium rectalis]|uniref:hypothetical protein n=1 Tax=Clostridium rectalis TaxID=2040295 RepID=UPI000F642624|nr:hypothetical protein [Clostridium rectalis]
MVFEDFLTIDYVATFMGTVVVTMLTVQFLKELPGIKKIPTKYFTFIIAFFNILICSIVKKNLSLSGLYLISINSMMVTFTATGGYDFTIKTIKFDKEKNVDN